MRPWYSPAVAFLRGCLLQRTSRGCLRRVAPRGRFCSGLGGVLLLFAAALPIEASAQETAAESESSKPAAGAPGAQREPSDETKADREKKPRVVPPKLEHYEPPVYPEEAFEKGLEATVRLLITVTAEGTVEEPEVVDSAGQGFDEAALAAAPKLRFRPAQVAGKPRTVRIGFEYVFAIDEVEKAEEPSESDADSTQERQDAVGELEGRLLIAETETALPGVEVQVTDDLGSVYRAVTDEEGFWELPGLPPGRYQVRVEVEGFRPVDSQERVAAGKVTELTYRLFAETNELEVIVEGERPPREVTRRRLDRREVARIPGTSGDAIRSIQSLPGVARSPGLAGLLIVRGSAPGDSETFVDGTNVPLIYHFGGLSSVIPTDMLDRLDFYPGNFSVRYGRLRGGVVDVGLRSPDTDCYDDVGKDTGRDGCFHGMAQVDLIDGRIMLQGPIAGDWEFAVAGRRSWLDTWLAPVLEEAGSTVTNAPVYYDYQVIVERDRGPGDKLSFRFFGADDRFETIINDPAATDPGFGGNLRFGTAFSLVQALYKKDLTDKVNLDTMVSVGKQSIDFALGGNLSLQVDTIPILFRSELGFAVHPTTKINVGLDYLASDFDVFVRAPPPGRPGEAAPGPLATQRVQETQSSGLSFRPGWYLDVEWQPSERLRFVPGIRLDTGLDTGSPDVSPRMNFRYTLFSAEDDVLFEGPRKTVLKGGVGKFSQPPAFQETDEIFGTPGINSNDSIHYSVGLEQGLSEQIDLSVEGFYKDFYNAVSRSPNELGTQTYNNQGSGQVIGLETLLKYNADEKFFGWVAYTLSESLRRDCDTCPAYRFQYDQTHNFVVLGSYRLGGGWEIGGRFRVISGPLVTPTLQPPSLPSIYAGDAGTYVALSGQPFSERLPLFHQADVRIDKHFTFRTWRFSTYLDIRNLYNNMAAEGYVYNFDFSQKAYQTGLPILPSIGLRGEF